jgi:hypothetical protein
VEGKGGPKCFFWGIRANGLWLSLGPGIQGKLHFFEASQNPEELSVPLEERFAVGFIPAMQC